MLCANINFPDNAPLSFCIAEAAKEQPVYGRTAKVSARIGDDLEVSGRNPQNKIDQMRPSAVAISDHSRAK